MVEQWSVKGTGIAICERMPGTMLALRVRRPSAGDLERIGALLGTPLPLVPNRAADGAVRLLWTGPDEWLILGSDVSPAALEAAAADAAAALCVAVGDGRCVFEVTGDHAIDLLAKGTSIDLHPTVFTADHAVLTLFAQVHAILDRPPAVGGFRIIADVSIRAYLQQWLADAIVEFG